MNNATPSWYDFRAAAGNKAEVFIYDGIGAFGVSAQAFVADLARHQGKDLTLRINSPGGSVTDASAIFNALQRHTGSVTAQIDGLAASAATFIACAAKRVKMAANALFMVHNPASGGGGGAADLRRLADVLDKITASMVNVYAAKTGKTSATIREKMAAETWFSAEEAKAFGFVDEITDAIDATAHFDLSMFVHPPGGAVRFGAFQAPDLTAKLAIVTADRDRLQSAINADGLFALVDGKLTLTKVGEARFINAGITTALAATGHAALPIAGGRYDDERSNESQMSVQEKLAAARAGAVANTNAQPAVAAYAQAHGLNR